MAKGIYVGVNGVAKKVKKMYLGVDTQVPIMSETTQQLTLNDTNLKEFFDVSAETGTNKWTPLNITGGGVSFSPGNYGVNSTTATCTLTAKENLTNIVIGYSYVTEKSYDKVTITRNGSTLLNAASGSNTGTFDATTLAKGQTIKLTYTKDSSQSASGEKVNIDITCDPIQKTVQTITGYEMQEIARKIKKGYIGVGGVARPFFGSGELTYIGSYADAYSVGRVLVAVASVGDSALFAGGMTRLSAVTSISKDFIVSTETSLTYGRQEIMSASVGNYALFAGGTYRFSGTADPYSTVDAYDTSFTRTTPTSLSEARGSGAGLSTGTYALIGGGVGRSENVSNPTSSAIDAYDSSLTRINLGTLPHERRYGGAMAGSNAIFAGGGYGSTSYGNHSLSTVHSYSAEFVRSTLSSLSQARSMLAGASIGKKYAAFFGGASSVHYGTSQGSITYYNTIDIYDDSLVKVYSGSVSAVKKVRSPAGGTLGDNAIFAGGAYEYSYETDEDTAWGLAYPKQAFAYDENLLYKSLDGISIDEGGSATVGDYCFFGTDGKNIHVFGLI